MKSEDEWKNIDEKTLDDLEEALRESASTQEEIFTNLSRTEKGKVKNTLANCVYALQHDPQLRGIIRRNDLYGRIEITGPVPWKRRGAFLTDTDENNIRFYLEERYELSSEKNVRAALDIVANENSYHPIVELLDSLVWDGEHRIRHALHRFLGAEEDEYTAEVMQMHMLAAISRVKNPGCKYDLALCVVGPQGCGKSTFFRFLAIRDEWFNDDIRRLEDENIYRRLAGHWIIELSEMSATVNAKSNEETKSFLSRQKDTYKVPYDVHPEDRPRQCVFCGSSNDMHFLPFDRSGNRRFAPVPVDPDRAEVHPLDDEQETRNYILQMWAEAMTIYREGNFRLTFSEEMEDYARQLQKDFMPEDTEMGIIEVYLDGLKGGRTCVKQIYCEALNHFRTEEVPYRSSKQITEILRLLGWKDIGSRRFAEFGNQKAWIKESDNPTVSGEYQLLGDQTRLPDGW